VVDLLFFGFVVNGLSDRSGIFGGSSQLFSLRSVESDSSVGFVSSLSFTLFGGSGGSFSFLNRFFNFFGHFLDYFCLFLSIILKKKQIFNIIQRNKQK
jgi:hypothetical protein